MLPLKFRLSWCPLPSMSARTIYHRTLIESSIQNKDIYTKGKSISRAATTLTETPGLRILPCGFSILHREREPPLTNTARPFAFSVAPSSPSHRLITSINSMRFLRQIFGVKLLNCIHNLVLLNQSWVEVMNVGRKMQTTRRKTHDQEVIQTKDARHQHSRPLFQKILSNLDDHPSVAEHNTTSRLHPWQPPGLKYL